MTWALLPPRLAALLLGAGVAVCACNDSAFQMEGLDSGVDGALPPERSADQCRDGLDNDRDGATDCADTGCLGLADCAGHDAGGRDTGGSGQDAEFEECDGISAEASNGMAPVDIILVVDSSSSMGNDARAVQENMDDFADFIAGAGIDFHLIMISGRDFVTPSGLFTTDPERFLFIDRDVGSELVFSRALDQFPSYEDFLRPMALTHIVGVTDDDDVQSASSFISQMNELLGQSFTFHAIAARAGAFGIPCTRGYIPAASVGDEYFAAAAATGGLDFSICTNDWSGLFHTLAETVAVTEELPCAFELPEPPPGMVFDPMQVNVEHTPEGGVPTVLPFAGEAGACGSTNAWYYDSFDSPSQIILCPTACTTVTSGPGRVEIQLGCATVII